MGIRFDTPAGYNIVLADMRIGDMVFNIFKGKDNANPHH